MSLIVNTDKTKVIAIEVPVPNILKSINFYLVERNESLFLIDAGYNEDIFWEYFQSSLQKYGYQLSDLDAILLTHHHIDHVGLVYRIREQHDIPVYIHPHAGPKLKRDPFYLYKSYQFFKDLYIKLNTGDLGQKKIESMYKKQMAVEVSAIDWNLHEIQQDKVFDFEVIHIPGHASDQIAFYIPEEDILFGGDLIIEHQTVSAFIEPPFKGERVIVLKEHLQSLEKIVNLNPALILSGHGIPIKDGAALAKKRITLIENKSESFLKLIENERTTASEIVKERHPVKYEKIFPIVMGDALGFLDYLEDSGRISKEEIDGIWHYKAH
ncbi:MBL fold metallo-hydrolase [Oceanobacillus sp. CAU 1775]